MPARCGLRNDPHARGARRHNAAPCPRPRIAAAVPCRSKTTQLRVTILVEGGHIAEVLDKRSGINPLWTPQWDSIEPSTFDASRHASYGGPADGALLAGIMGHNLCLDIFGGPSPEEAAAGLTAHGEASVAPYAIDMNGYVSDRARRPHASRASRCSADSNCGAAQWRSRRRSTNLTACDRPVGWTQHVTLGPPFLKNGVTEFRASATRSKVFEGTFGPADYLVAGATFDWPHAPRHHGGTVDLQRYTDAPASSAYTAHLMDPSRAEAFFVAFRSGRPARVRLPVAPCGFSVDGHLGGKPQPAGFAVERPRDHARNGIRRLAVPRNTARDDRRAGACSTHRRFDGSRRAAK